MRAGVQGVTLDTQPNGCLYSRRHDTRTPAVTDHDLVFRALADASRRKLLDRLHAQNGQTLSELCRGLKMTRQAVTKHLAVLEAANLISWQREGREKLHYINTVPLNAVAERWISKFEHRRLSALSALKHHVEGNDK
jgi:DNA-binding transcriptional ArsR family regulator